MEDFQVIKGGRKNDNDNDGHRHKFLKVKDFIDLNWEIRKNTVTMELEYRTTESPSFKPIDDAVLSSIWLKTQFEGFNISDSVLVKILNSELTPNYNPFKEFFKNLPKWDGEDHIQQLADTLKIAAGDEKNNRVSQKDLWEPYLKKWLVGAVAQVLDKGSNHLCLILVGAQGKGKTTWLNKLCPDKMKDHLMVGHINPTLTDNNTANLLAEKWLVNIDDQLDYIFGKDFNSLKSIITTPTITNRKVFQRFTKTRKRTCSFMGSVNNVNFLTDTENRRYLVFTVEDIDFKHEVDILQVWSQAKELLKNKHQYWFNAEEIKTLNRVNESYRQAIAEEEWLQKMFSPAEPVDPKAKPFMASEILTKLNEVSGLKLRMSKLSQALQHYGYKQVSKRIQGQPRNVYMVLEN